MFITSALLRRGRILQERTIGYVAQVNYRYWVLLNVAMNRPHPQPFSPGRRELRFLFPLLWESARLKLCLMKKNCTRNSYDG